MPNPIYHISFIGNHTKTGVFAYMKNFITLPQEKLLEKEKIPNFSNCYRNLRLLTIINDNPRSYGESALNFDINIATSTVLRRHFSQQLRALKREDIPQLSTHVKS